MPVSDMIPMVQPGAPEEVRQAAKSLKFNSIAICLIHVTRDNLRDIFAVMVPDKTILFHRISKLDFLVPEDGRDGTTRFMVEVTYRDGDQISKLNDEELLDRVVEDLVRLKFIAEAKVVQARQMLRQKHAYVIYDLHHRKNMKTLREYCEGRLGLTLHGRFGEFDYLNMDAVIERSMKRAEEILA
jgi:protoporphyrinogen oxidase